MGQKVGKASFIPDARPFLNGNRTIMEALWLNFNQVAEGFGLNLAVFQTICGNVEGLRVTPADCERIFRAFDSDKNGLVDALEFLTTFALASAMTEPEKIRYTFRCYDFDESNELTVDEMTLSLKSTLTGLAKLTGQEVPDDLELEDIAQLAFTKADKNRDHKISFAEYQEYCMSNPEVQAWMAFFDDSVEDADVAKADTDSEMELEGKVRERSNAQEAQNDPDASLIFKMEDNAGGDEFMAVKPWLGTVLNSVPSVLPKIDPSPPDLGVELEWVHGYRCDDSRNNVRYNAEGDIVYPAAGLGVAYSPGSHTQRYNLDHTDDVISLAIHPSGDFVATGEMGAVPKIVIWKSTDKVGFMDSEVILKGFHRRAVLQLAFSPNGKYLASVGQDDDHSVAIWDWRNKTKVYSDKSDKNKVLACAFLSDDTLVTCGDQHIYFWDINTKTKKKGLFGKSPGVKLQALVSLACLNNGAQMASGTASGHIYAWQGRNCVKAVKAHEANTAALYSCASGLVSGGKDGKVKLWSFALEARGSFDLAGLGSYNPSVRSICWDPARRLLLAGTLGGEIYEFSADDGTNMHDGPLIQGHCKWELWGLAVHPDRSEYATVGDDGTLRIWDAISRKQLRMKVLGGMSRAIAYSPDGKYLAIGYGGRLGGPTEAESAGAIDGSFAVLRSSDLVVSHQAKDAQKWISDIRFSPDGKTLAVASHDNKVYLYNTVDFSAKAKIRKSSSYISHIDFSADSVFLQTNDGAYELLYYDAETGIQQVSATAMKDVDWATWSCVLGWPVQGIWPAFSDGTDINAVDRSHNRQVLATADDFGLVKLFRNPCVDKGSLSVQCRGHSSHVMNVRWLEGDKYLVTVGGNDKCIFQWRVTWNDPDPDARQASIEFDTDDEVLIKKDGAKIERSEAHAAAASLDMAGLFQMEEDTGGGDEFMAVKPWLGAIVEPSAPPPQNPSVPAEELHLHWVHGYRAMDSSNNLRYTARGELVYPAAGLGVCFSTKKWHQRYMFAHTDDVICLAMHPDGIHVATGQMGKRPSIVVWRSDTMAPVVTLQGLHRRAVCQLSFSADGRFLASVGQDDDHTVGVYDWAANKLKASAQGDKNKSLAIAFSPDGSTVCQVGVQHIRFHEIQGRNVKTTKGVLRKKGLLQPFLAVEYLGDAAMVGTSDGHIYQFAGNELKAAINAHTGPVHALYSCAAGFVSGGKDGLVKVWSPAMDLVSEFNMKERGSIYPAIRSVCWDATRKRLLVGTLGSEIFELNARDGSVIQEGPVMNGHFRDELWGLSWHPTKPEFATVGDDAMLRIWNAKTFKQLKCAKLGTMSRAVAYSPDGSKIAVGIGGRVGRGKNRDDGKWLVLREEDLEKLHDARDSRQWISDVKWSPDGAILAIGSHDNKIYFYNAEHKYTPLPTFEKHNSYITHFDFSQDGRFCQSNDGAYELLFADIATGAHIPAASSLKDVKWASWTCVLGWPVQGIWPPFADGTDVNAVDRSSDHRLLASADDFGRVKLFRYPASSKSAAYKEYRGHSSHVMNCRWSKDSETLVTVGGNDRCVFQWSIHEKPADAPTEPIGEVLASVAAATDGKPADAVPARGAAGAPVVTAAGAKRLEAEVEVAVDAVDEDPDVDKGFDVFTMEAGGGGDEFMAVKPWLGAIVAPSAPPSSILTQPKVRLDLEWVYGYRGFDARDNVRYNDADGIVYHSAGVGIVYDRSKHSQKFYIGHDDDIVSLAVDPSGNFVATGQLGAKPRVHIWDSESGSRLAVLPLVHRRAIPALAFSPDGKQLVSVGEDDNHTVALYSTASGNWVDGKLDARCMGDPNKVLWAQFLPIGSGFTFATGGVKHVRFWTVGPTGLTSKKGIFGAKAAMQPLLCATTVGGSLVTGTVSGELYIWEGNTVTRTVRVVLDSTVKVKSVTSLYSFASGFVSGHKDGSVKVWTNTFQVKEDFDLNTAKPAPLNSAVRSVCVKPDASVVLIGTQGCEIYELALASKRFTQRVEGHFENELWGLATHPAAPNLAVTAGDDKTIRLWDLHRHQMLRKVAVDAMARAVSWSPDGTLLGVGFGGRVGGETLRQKDGAHAIMRADTLDMVHQGRDSKQWIQDVKFNADGTTFAVGSHDNIIYLYDARGGRFTLRGRCTAHQSYITHFDFSRCGTYLQSNCGAYELLFFNAASGEQIPAASSTRDADWASWTCVLGWPVQGIWPKEADGTDINAVDRSHSQKYLATSDDFGRVNVFNYPCLEKGLPSVSGLGHSSHVTNVRWNADDSYLLTTGGNDKSLFQWKVTYLK